MYIYIYSVDEVRRGLFTFEVGQDLFARKELRTTPSRYVVKGRNALLLVPPISLFVSLSLSLASFFVVYFPFQFHPGIACTVELY